MKKAKRGDGGDAIGIGATVVNRKIGEIGTVLSVDGDMVSVEVRFMGDFDVCEWRLVDVAVIDGANGSED